MARGSVQVDGQTRTYRVFVPARPKKPAALVLVFHGGFGTGARVASQTGFDAEAEKRGFIAVYPDGLGRAWNAGPCCGAPSRLGVNDVGFVAKLLDKLGRQYSIDKRRIFATGISNGGLFSYALACRLSGRIAAAAPVAATLITEPCSSSRPVSILHVHGLDDENIPFEGGQGTRGVVDLEWPPAQAGIDRWRALDGCPGGEDGGQRRRHHELVDAVPQRDRGAARDDRRSWSHVAKGAVQRDFRDLAFLRRSRPPVALALQLLRQVAHLEARPGRRGDRRSPRRGPSSAAPGWPVLRSDFGGLTLPCSRTSRRASASAVVTAFDFGASAR